MQLPESQPVTIGNLKEKSDRIKTIISERKEIFYNLLGENPTSTLRKEKRTLAEFRLQTSLEIQQLRLEIVTGQINAVQNLFDSTIPETSVEAAILHEYDPSAKGRIGYLINNAVDAFPQLKITPNEEHDRNQRVTRNDFAQDLTQTHEVPDLASQFEELEFLEKLGITHPKAKRVDGKEVPLYDLIDITSALYALSMFDRFPTNNDIQHSRELRKAIRAIVKESIRAKRDALPTNPDNHKNARKGKFRSDYIMRSGKISPRSKKSNT